MGLKIFWAGDGFGGLRRAISHRGDRGANGHCEPESVPVTVLTAERIPGVVKPIALTTEEQRETVDLVRRQQSTPAGLEGKPVGYPSLAISTSSIVTGGPVGREAMKKRLKSCLDDGLLDRPGRGLVLLPTTEPVVSLTVEALIKVWEKVRREHPDAPPSKEVGFALAAALTSRAAALPGTPDTSAAPEDFLPGGKYHLKPVAFGTCTGVPLGPPDGHPYAYAALIRRLAGHLLLQDGA